MSIGTLLSSLLAMIISLAFVVALAWGTLWLLKRFQDGSFGKFVSPDGGRSLRFEKALPIGPRERLVLVEVDGEQMLLGVTAHAITTIKTWPARVPDDAGPDLHPASPESARSAEGGKEQARRFRLRMAEQDREA